MDLVPLCNLQYLDVLFYMLASGGAYGVLDYRITVYFFENYRTTVIKFLSKYCHRSTFYQTLYFPVTVGWLKYRIPSIFYSNHRITAKKIGKYRIPSYRTPPPIYNGMKRYEEKTRRLSWLHRMNRILWIIYVLS